MIAQNEAKRLLVVFSPSLKIGKLIWITNHFQRLKFINLLSILHVERAYELKERNVSVFFSHFAAKKEVSSTLVTWISSVLPRSIKSGKNSTSWIDGGHSIPTFPKVNNSCIKRKWIEIQCPSCCCYRWSLNYTETSRRGHLLDNKACAL